MMKMWRRKNSKKGRVKEKIRNFRMPRLSAGQRFLLYVVTILFIVLSLLGAGLEYFPYAVRIVIYVAAMCLLSAAVFYLVSDIKNGMIVSIKKKIERNVYLRKLKENDRLRMILSAVPGTAGKYYICPDEWRNRSDQSFRMVWKSGSLLYSFEYHAGADCLAGKEVCKAGPAGADEK